MIPKARQFTLRIRTLKAYAISIGTILLLTAVIDIIQESLPEYQFNASIYNVSMVYLLAIVFCAMRFGVWPASVAALCSFVLYNYFFIPPFYAFALNQVSDVLNFVLFLSAALICVSVAAAYRRNFVALVEEKRIALALQKIMQHATGITSPQKLAEKLAETMTALLDSPVRIVLGEQSDTNDEAYKIPLETPRHMFGLVYMGEEVREDFAKALCAQAAQSFEALTLHAEHEEIRLKHEKEEIRSALLSSVSHDLKTPLVSIIGALSSLILMREKLSKEDSLSLVEGAHSEAERLNAAITNILELTKMESGSLRPTMEWLNVSAMLHDNVQRQRMHMESRAVRITCDDTLLILADATLFSSLCENLLANFIRHTQKDAELHISVEESGEVLALYLQDNGPGIPPGEWFAVFDKFTRIAKRDSTAKGTGLGLAICAAVMQLLQGSIRIIESAHADGLRIAIMFENWKHETKGTQK